MVNTSYIKETVESDNMIHHIVSIIILIMPFVTVKVSKKNISKKKTKKVRVKAVPRSVVHQAFIEDLLHAEHGAAHHSLSGEIQILINTMHYKSCQLINTLLQKHK